MRPCKDLIIIGTGGNAYDALDVIELLNGTDPVWRVRGFLDDARNVGSTYLRLPVLGGVDDARELLDCSLINVIGSDRTFEARPDVIARTTLPADRFATLVHPLASVSSR